VKASMTLGDERFSSIPTSCCAGLSLTIRGHAVAVESRRPPCWQAASRSILLFRTSREFWNVATRPVAHNGLGFSATLTLSEVGKIEHALTLLPESPATYGEWKRLVVEHNVLGSKVHDTRLVAAMNVYGVRQIITFNTADFRPLRNRGAASRLSADVTKAHFWPLQRPRRCFGRVVVSHPKTPSLKASLCRWRGVAPGRTQALHLRQCGPLGRCSRPSSPANRRKADHGSLG